MLRVSAKWKRQTCFRQNKSFSNFSITPQGQDLRVEGTEAECSRSSSAPVVDTCSHPTALLQRFHRITQKRHVRVTQFISLSSPFICSHRCTTGGSVSSRALVTSEERAPFFFGLSSSHRAVLQAFFPTGGTAAPYVADDYNSVAGWRRVCVRIVFAFL